MIQSDELKTIQNIVQNFTGIKTIYAYQDHPRPLCDYISMYMIDEQPIGYAQNLEDKIFKQFKMVVCFDSIGQNPYEFSRKLSMMWELESIRLLLKGKMIAWNKSGNMINTTHHFDEKYTNRITQEITFSVNRLMEEKNSIDKIDGVSIKWHQSTT